MTSLLLIMVQGARGTNLYCHYDNIMRSVYISLATKNGKQWWIKKFWWGGAVTKEGQAIVSAQKCRKTGVVSIVYCRFSGGLGLVLPPKSINDNFNKFISRKSLAELSSKDKRDYTLS